MNESVESYLAEITARLPGPARTRAGIVAELRSGLLDATDAYRSAGLPPAQAVQAAIGEFGAPGQVADGFLAEIAARQARRLSVGLLAAGPLVGILWIAAALASHLGTHLALPWQWPDLSSALRAGIHLIAALIVAAACAALLAVAATGHLIRWLPARPRRAPIAALIAGSSTAGTDTIMLSLLAIELAVAPGKLSPFPVALAAAASLTRLTLATRAAHRCLATQRHATRSAPLKALTSAAPQPIRRSR